MKNPLNKRLPREFRKDFGKYLVIFLLLVITIGFVSGFLVADGSMIKAYNEGIDSCWINFFNPDELAQALNLPEEEEILMLLDLGTAAEGTGALPNHSSRKELAETVTYM